MKTSEKIVTFVTENNEVTAKALTDYLGISERAVFKQLKKLLEEGRLVKIGTPPKVFYKIPVTTHRPLQITHTLRGQKQSFIEENFLYITPLGKYLSGIEGFNEWCSERRLNARDQAEQYIKLHKQISKNKKNGLIVATDKFNQTFPENVLREVFYVDFYSLPQFGKTKLGQLILYAKQSQDPKLIREITADIADEISTVLKKYKIDAVGFIPPTVKRQTQFMRELERNLNIPLPVIELTKVKTEIIVAQKTLKKLEDRIANAKNTIMVEEQRVFENVLLIDDATGSGASLQETTKKLTEKKLAKNVYGLAIVGSYKGFEVISEV